MIEVLETSEKYKDKINQIFDIVNKLCAVMSQDIKQEKYSEKESSDFIYEPEYIQRTRVHRFRDYKDSYEHYYCFLLFRNWFPTNVFDIGRKNFDPI